MVLSIRQIVPWLSGLYCLVKHLIRDQQGIKQVTVEIVNCTSDVLRCVIKKKCCCESDRMRIINQATAAMGLIKSEGCRPNSYCFEEQEQLQGNLVLRFTPKCLLAVQRLLQK